MKKKGLIASVKKKLKLKEPTSYQIFGIFDQEENRIIFVSLDPEQTQMEFEFEGYDPDKYSIISFNIILH